MTLDRRMFLAGTTAALMTARPALSSPVVLRAEPVSAQILPEGEGMTAMLGFNGRTPGPEIRLRQGDLLSVTFENRTDQGSSLHWHGIRLPNAMDGVPGLTQDMVNPGQSHDYRFQVPDAGTFWYHSHNRSWEQVARGLYGPLIIEEPDPPRVDHDITVIVDDWRVEETGALVEGFGNRHDFAHAGRLGNYARIIPSRDRVRAGDRLRLRIINTATARVFPLRITGLEGSIVALDGMPLSAPRPLGDVDLAPAQRMDLIGQATESVEFFLITRDEPYKLGELAIDGENTSPLSGPVAALPRPNVPQPGAVDQRLELRMEGGAMGGRHAGDDVWAMNGKSGMQDTPFATFKRGETAVIDLINDTRFPHGMHLHGHHFLEMAADGTPGDLRDTSLVAGGQSRQIMAVFDNPGKWLLHCHMLGHQASGMKTWVEVT